MYAVPKRPPHDLSEKALRKAVIDSYCAANWVICHPPSVITPEELAEMARPRKYGWQSKPVNAKHRIRKDARRT